MLGTDRADTSHCEFQIVVVRVVLGSDAVEL